MLHPGGGEEERLASHWKYTPPLFFLFFSRRPEKGAAVAVLVQLSTAKYSPFFR